MVRAFFERTMKWTGVAFFGLLAHRAPVPRDVRRYPIELWTFLAC
ncbi:hypothetical protein Poly21_04040 [Allorhodopirellula heiligendammensis]|uniref:Uncharacterized protein n=1 Tax=Allorhodopirellula heiligendammensis TaxID=2714739 RepID=A0A5C6C642_9BACT|nr:hypothetical protein Poly21_04040 [Allorhodopirellula heiligendammensis]